MHSATTNYLRDTQVDTCIKLATDDVTIIQ